MVANFPELSKKILRSNIEKTTKLSEMTNRKAAGSGKIKLPE
jgi:hypothetical protein